MPGYLVPASAAEVELRFKNSRFIGTAASASDVGEAKVYVNSIRTRFPDASHHCYAFAAGFGATVVHGMSDDGEPSGTAGRPMLALVQGAGLGDIAVVVTRYFGGTKLGTGGLVRAYTETAQAVLAAIERVEKIETIGVLVELAYQSYEVCKRHIEALGAQVEAEDFGDHVELILRLDEERFTELRTTLQDATSGRALVERID